MFIKFGYTDNSVRILNLSESFFLKNDKEVFNIETSKDMKILKSKVESLMNDTGKCHSAVLYNGDQLLLTVEYPFNHPEKQIAYSEATLIKMKNNRKKAIKEAKKNIENKVFSFSSKAIRA